MTRSLHATAGQATSDYYGRSLGMRLMQLALGTAERLWPALAVRAAARLFGTPLPLRVLRRRRPWPPGWHAESWGFEQASVTLHTPQPLAEAPVGTLVLLVHGWAGHAQQMLPLAQQLLALGMRPVLVDLPAHGASAGRVSNLPQFSRAIDYVAARLAQQGLAVHAAAAHSLAANALAFSASRGLPARRLVLLAPPASPHGYTRLFANAFGLSETTRAAMQRLVEAREGIVMPQYEPEAAGPRIAVPTLVVHDRGDRINAFADGVAFSQAVPRARLVATEGLGHQRILKDEAVLREVAAFIAGAD